MDYPHPFLKWAGGKKRLVSVLQSRFPPNYNTYFEPCAGGAAPFFAIRPTKSVLGDSNQRLIRTYTAIRDNVDTVIGYLGEYLNNPVCFEFTRKRSAQIDNATDEDLAAWFIYLNKVAFNGLYRVNRDNGFNVPFGRYANPTICDAANLRACSEALQGVELKHADFATTLVSAKEGDVVYFDPPYVPISATSSFTNYTSDGFGLDDQLRLRDLALALSGRGVHVLISNSSAAVVWELYRGNQFHIQTVRASRSIAANAASRGSVDELLISTYRPEPARAAMRPCIAMTGT